jgi:hypothetical protein
LFATHTLTYVIGKDPLLLQKKHFVGGSLPLARQPSGVSRSRCGFFRIASRKERVLVIKVRHVCIKKLTAVNGRAQWINSSDFPAKRTDLRRTRHCRSTIRAQPRVYELARRHA